MPQPKHLVVDTASLRTRPLDLLKCLLLLGLGRPLINNRNQLIFYLILINTEDMNCSTFFKVQRSCYKVI